MTKKSKVFVIILSCVLLASIAVTGFGWFTSSRTEPIGVTSFVRKSYFQSGTGTAEQPFEIKYPVQLYYFTWLQNMGYFNIQQDDQHRVKPTHFYLSEDLDMSGFNLPPAGSQQFPFLGEFDGRDHKISNLTVCNQEGNGILTDVPKETQAADKSMIQEKTNPQIVGFFGVVGEYKGILSTNKQVVAVKNFDLENVTVQSNYPKDDKTLVGIAAGYINATVENVGVAGSTLKLGQNVEVLDAAKTTNFSDYTLAGYCTAEYMDQVDLVKTEVWDPEVKISRLSGIDAGNAWGGSIDMKSMYNRLLSVQNGASSTFSFPHVRNITTDINGKVTTEYSDFQSETRENYRIYDAGPGGRMTFNRFATDTEAPQYDIGAGGWTYTPYLYLYGGLPASMTTNNVTKTQYDGYRISDGTNYLNVSGTSIVSGTNAATATEWFFSNEAARDGVISRVMNGKTYYLYANVSGLGLSRTSSDGTVWSNENGTLYCTVNGIRFYMTCSSGTWKIEPVMESPVVITDGSGHYLKYNSTDGTDYFPAVGSAAEATKWTIGADQKIYTIYNGTVTYLSPSSHQLSTTTNHDAARPWTHDGTGYSCFDGDGVRCYLKCDGSSWSLIRLDNRYFISDNNGNYLSLNSNNNNFINTTDINQATAWEFSNSEDHPSGIISSNGAYLSSNKSGNVITGFNCSLSVTRSSNGVQSWNNNGSNGLYFSTSALFSGTKDHYIACSGGTWKLQDGGFNLNITPAPITSPPAHSEDVPPITLPTMTTQSHSYVDTVSSSTTGSIDYDAYATCVPLSTINDKRFADRVPALDHNSLQASPSNTGYVISGWKDNQDKNGNPIYSIQSGDIRVSQYEASKLNASFTGTYNESTVKIYSKSYLQPSDYTLIEGDDTAAINSLGLNKFVSSKALFNDVIRGQSNVYGLHFMNAQIDKNNTLTADYDVYFNGDTYHNFQFPKDSIDFTLKESGFINFFAGTYFPGNKSFFSLHEIIRQRDAEGKPVKNTNDVYAIDEIKEISKVFGNPNNPKAPYVYQYVGGAAPSLPQGYVEMFDTAWIKNNTVKVDNAIYYFEIPVNAGEYALGSVPGSDGAYLMYLDISAGAQEIRRTDVTEYSAVDSQTVAYPRGIQLLEQKDLGKNTPLDATDSVFASLPSAGITTKISRTGDHATMTGTGQKAVYIGDGITLTNDSGVMSAEPLSSDKKVTKVFTRTDYNVTMDETTTTVTTTEEVYKNGQFISRTANTSVNGGTGEPVTDPPPIVLPQDTALVFHYVAIDAPIVTQNISHNEITVDHYPAVGDDPVDYPGIKRYDVSITTDKDIAIYMDKVDAKYKAYINNQPVDTGQEITISLTGTP